ncbi:hypothetical protein COU53_01350 [Candidatus Pacearchaeota archaeon CG10_big_fil_rev_8_21_14_0_10_30_48]|nr:MAG: hypothetical protein COU53_01350 [Candidatus Pacearchaeota archaeon CG10_big_fil_rev_8_21_14_0_10_30_48]
MSEKIRVGDVMTRKFTYVSPNASLYDTSKSMVKNRVGSIILKEGDDLKGIITEKDIVWAIAKKKFKDLHDVKAKDIATKKVITIKPEATLTEALEKLNRNKLRRMPVISNKKIVGYVTLKDVVKFIPSIFQESREFEKIREESEKLKRSESASSGNFIESPCEDCGNFDILETIDGRMICESCKDAM